MPAAARPSKEMRGQFCPRLIASWDCLLVFRIRHRVLPGSACIILSLDELSCLSSSRIFSNFFKNSRPHLRSVAGSPWHLTVNSGSSIHLHLLVFHQADMHHHLAYFYFSKFAQYCPIYLHHWNPPLSETRYQLDRRWVLPDH